MFQGINQSSEPQVDKVEHQNEPMVRTNDALLVASRPWKCNGHNRLVSSLITVSFLTALTGCTTSVGDLFFNSATAAGQTFFDLGFTAFVNGVADAFNPSAMPPADSGGTTGGGGDLSGLTGNATNGQMLFTANNCAACHCADATGGCALSAPSLIGVSAGLIDDHLRGAASHPGGKFTLTDQEIVDLESFLASGATGAKLFDLISKTDPYTQWNQFPDAQGTLVSNPPHGPMSKVFINNTVESALNNFTGTLPEGSVIVKENIGQDPAVTESVLTVMWKVKGFDPANNDWFWANLDKNGVIKAEGKVQTCAACHGGAKTNDFVFVHQF